MVARFITFEGGEGVGKSTQITLLAARLAQANIDSVATREPGGTKRAEDIRRFILEGHGQSWGPAAEAVLFSAARADHVKELIAPTLAAGKWVLCDRFFDSTSAYQGVTDGVPDKLVRNLNALAINGQIPDLTIVLDMDPEAGLARVVDRSKKSGAATEKDRFESELLDWHTKLRAAYLDIAKKNSARCVVVSAEGDAEAVEARIWQVVRDKFPDDIEVGQELDDREPDDEARFDESARESAED